MQDQNRLSSANGGTSAGFPERFMRNITRITAACICLGIVYATSLGCYALTKVVMG